VQAAALLDVKRDYFRLRPHLGRLYLSVRDPRPFLDALRTLGFRPFDEPIEVGGEPFHLAALDFGPDSVDGWLNRIAAAELGESDQPFLDERDRSVDLGGARIQLSPLEFGVLNMLATHPATPVSRADLLREVWGTSYDGGSNTVDVVIRSLRRKLGAVADRIETVRGVGYRLR
jgi:DNA-binding response OmpR family regulator